MFTSFAMYVSSCLTIMMSLQVLCSVIPEGPNSLRHPRQVTLDQAQMEVVRPETAAKKEVTNENEKIQRYLSAILGDEVFPTKDVFVSNTQSEAKWEDTNSESNSDERQLAALAKNSPKSESLDGSYTVKSPAGNEDEQEKSMFNEVASHKIGFGAFSPAVRTNNEVINNDSMWLDESVSQISVKPRRGFPTFSTDKEKALIEVETVLLSLLKASQKAGITTQDIADHLHHRFPKTPE